LGRWASPYVAEARTDQQNGSLTIAASLAPDVADALIIGGLPRSRLPLLYALIALVSGLIAIALVQMRRESELVRLREHFVAGVSHELRTPLAQIRMFAETLALGRVRTAEESRRSLGIIVRESQRLSHLVDNVLCFSRTTRAEFAARPEQVAIKQVLLDLIQTIEPLTRTRGVTFEVEAHESDCAMVDQGAFKQILLNLLDNAVKYGPDGQVVRITACKRGRTTQVTVDDQGPGIPADALQRIWQPFWRGPDSAQGGSGIGLSIVQQLAQAHEGRAYVERSNTGGARFVVELADRASNTSMPDLALQQSS
jgi:signal transduction histidine kinase